MFMLTGKLGTFEDVVELLIPELRKRGIYPEARNNSETLTAREKIYGPGQKGVRDDHIGAKYRYDVYPEEPSTTDVSTANEDTKS
jgi:hypothetical protein